MRRRLLRGICSAQPRLQRRPSNRRLRILQQHVGAREEASAQGILRGALGMSILQRAATAAKRGLGALDEQAAHPRAAVQRPRPRRRAAVVQEQAQAGVLGARRRLGRQGIPALDREPVRRDRDPCALANSISYCARLTTQSLSP